jgi:hypothetical protein
MISKLLRTRIVLRVKKDGTHSEPKKHSPKAFGILSGVIKHGWLENPPFVDDCPITTIYKGTFPAMFD